MKEIEVHQKDTIELVKQPEVKKMEAYLGTYRPKNGHTLYEYHLIEKTLKPASYWVESVLVLGGSNGQRGISTRKIMVKDNCLYIPALNEKNAWRILKKQYGIQR